MKQLLCTALLIITTFSPVKAMEIQPLPFPQELSEYIVIHQLHDIHNQVATSKEARDYLWSVSLVNQSLFKYVNDPQNTCTIIKKLSKKLLGSNGASANLAEFINTPGARMYNALSMLLTQNDATPEKIKNLVTQGADANYTYKPVSYPAFPLQYWVTQKHYGNVQALLECGADINQRTCSDYLYGCIILALTDNKEMVSLLLSYKPTHIPLYYAINRPDDIFKLLLKTCKNEDKQEELNQSLLRCVNEHNASRATQLLDAGAQPENAIADLAPWIVGQYVSTDSFRPAPANMLQLFCQYPITNPEVIAQTCDKMNAIIEAAQGILALLNPLLATDNNSID